MEHLRTIGVFVALGLMAVSGARQARACTAFHMERAGRQLVATGGDAEADPVDEAFGILEAVSMGSHTRWNIVWEPGPLRVHFRTSSSKTIKVVEIGRFDPSCRTPPRMLDIHRDESGDVADRFVPYRKRANRRMLYTTLSAYKANPFYPMMVVTLASYPDGCICTE